jgi:hypothetical protein
MTNTRFPLHPGIKYEDLPEKTKAGLAALERAADDPKTKLAERALSAWTDSLTDEEKQWLRHTEAGCKEMWRRFGLAFELCAPLKKEMPPAATQIRQDEISIDANRASEEVWRLERLDLLRRLILHQRHYFLEQGAHVLQLYDHKGALAVNWSETPSVEQQGLLKDFWETAFFEPIIDHFVNGRQITDNNGWDGAPLTFTG